MSLMRLTLILLAETALHLLSDQVCFVWVLSPFFDKYLPGQRNRYECEAVR